MITPIARANTAERWWAALDRAHREGISVRQLTASGAWIATSTTDPHIAYEVSVHQAARFERRAVGLKAVAMVAVFAIARGEGNARVAEREQVLGRLPASGG